MLRCFWPFCVKVIDFLYFFQLIFYSEGDFMISFLSQKLADFLCKKNIISCEEKEVYTYGYEIIITTIIGAVFIFGTAVWLKRIPEATVFFLIFVVTRQFCGGYHAQTRIMCSIIFFACYIFFLIINDVLSESYAWWIHLILLIPYMAVILGYAPIENKNKPLDHDEKRINRIKSIAVSVIWIIISFVFLLLKPILASAVALTLLVIALMMMIEIIKARR